MNNNKYKVLVVEDDDNIIDLVEALLETNGYQSLSAHNCATANMLFSSHVPDLVILDLGLPDQDGTEFIKNIRKGYSTPIIVLSARTNESDKVNALDLGANDYITKPFGSAELMARIRSVLRSTRRVSEETEGKFHRGDLVIDYDLRQIFVADQELHFTQTEFNIMALLAQHCGKVLTYAMIIREIWGGSDPGSVKRLQVNMANIRRKMNAVPAGSKYIINVLGVGYRIDPQD